jgi:hypothetical protein
MQWTATVLATFATIALGCGGQVITPSQSSDATSGNARYFVEPRSVIASPIKDDASMKAYSQRFATIKRRQRAASQSAEAYNAQQAATLEKFGYRFVGEDLVHDHEKGEYSEVSPSTRG